MLIPQGMSYATLAGLNPIIGLYCYVPLVVYALMGTSSFISVGPVALVSTTLFGMIVAVEYASQKEAQGAIDTMHGEKLMGQEISVDWAFNRGPSRSGGGGA